MKANKEKRETFKRLYSEGKTIKGIARELKVTAGTVRSWRKIHFSNSTPRREIFIKKFKELYLRKNKDFSEIAKILGVSRHTVYYWRKKIYPENPKRESMFLKIINHEYLTVNEIACLLGMTRSGVLRLYKKAGSVPDELKNQSVRIVLREFMK